MLVGRPTLLLMHLSAKHKDRGSSNSIPVVGDLFGTQTDRRGANLHVSCERGNEQPVGGVSIRLGQTIPWRGRRLSHSPCLGGALLTGLLCEACTNGGVSM